MSRRIVSLNGDQWLLGEVPGGVAPGAGPSRMASVAEMERIGTWLPSTVPGNVRADLQRAGRLRDLTFGLNAEESQWVDASCWWLAGQFALEGTDQLGPGRGREHLLWLRALKDNAAAGPHVLAV